MDIKGFVRESSGKGSSSRAVVLIALGFFLAVFLGFVAWTVYANLGKEADELIDLWNGTGIGDAMQWGVVVMLGAFMNYIGGKVAEKRNGGGA